MHEEHPVFKEPDNKEVKIWRYMDFTKFVSLLEKEAIFFTRADKFRDKFEGTTGNFNKIMYPIIYGQYDLTKDEIDKLLSDSIRFNARLREETIINCWHINEYESAAMWDLYVKSNDGIAIQTTYKKFVDCFHKEERKIYIGKVEYIDFETQFVPEDNMYAPYIHKRKSFEHESEVRAIYSTFPIEGEPPPYDMGDYINIDLELLIENIYVSPDSPKWFSDLVQSVILKYEVNKQVIHSSLYDLPR